ncbi:PKD domain-containing protein [Actinoplanes italicus]|nr:PKD domain-containing protein [Actinoplanes italicus]
MSRSAAIVAGVMVLLSGAVPAHAAEAAPTHDAFADRITIPPAGLPYADLRDYRSATREAGEPASCTSGFTGWYTWTPADPGSVTLRTNPGSAGIALYTGSTLDRLGLQKCSIMYSYTPITFAAQAGTTYQIAVLGDGNDEHTLHLEVAPPPEMTFYHYPEQPDSLNPISFSSSGGDPAGAGITSYAWDFGNGTTSTEANPVHRLPADGDYPVKLTVRTVDGRSATESKVVPVRTHDVGIVKLTVPKRAGLGQKIQIHADVQNLRYEENVRVQLGRAAGNSGWTTVDEARKVVPVGRPRQSTRFTFTYTVTQDDLVAGKLIFNATADPDPNRDAYTIDNELRSATVTIR